MTFIATVEIDEVTFSWLDALRRAHFPAERNFLSAHLTLFHTLQSEQVDRLRAIGLPRHALPLEFTGVRFLGAGVAIDVRAPELDDLRDTIKRQIDGSLTAQDAQRWRPHVTVQNKVTPDRAKGLHRKLSQHFEPRRGRATGLRLWRYLGGPWEPVERLVFGPGSSMEATKSP